MVFVHARNATVKTALTLREMASNRGDTTLFHAKQSPEYGTAEKQVQSRVQLCEEGEELSEGWGHYFHKALFCLENYHFCDYVYSLRARRVNLSFLRILGNSKHIS